MLEAAPETRHGAKGPSEGDAATGVMLINCYAVNRQRGATLRRCPRGPPLRKGGRLSL